MIFPTLIYFRNVECNLNLFVKAYITFYFIECRRIGFYCCRFWINLKAMKILKCSICELLFKWLLHPGWSAFNNVNADQRITLHSFPERSYVYFIVRNPHNLLKVLLLKFGRTVQRGSKRFISKIDTINNIFKTPLVFIPKKDKVHFNIFNFLLIFKR